MYLPKGETLMGPIERELRTAPVENEAIYQWVWTAISHETRLFVIRSSEHGVSGSRHRRLLPDVLSDAIEYAASEGI